MARLTPEALDLITRVVIGEAGGEPPEGMIAVANVLKNRLNSGLTDSTRIGPVIHARSQFDSVGGKAFTAALPNDPNYQRAAAIVQAVFADQTPDNTNGATHFYAPQGMPGGVAPIWAQGKPGQKIGSQYFYNLPLNAAMVGGTGSDPSGPTGPAMGVAPTGFAYGGEAPQDQGVDVRHLEPVFAARIAKLQADAAAAGIKTHLTDGYRDNKSQASAYARLGAQHLAAAPGQSYHQFGRAVDLVADNPAQQMALVALADQPGRGLVAGAHFATPDRVHFQAAEGKSASLLEAGASAPDKPIGQGGVGSDANAPLGTASPGPPAVSTIVPNQANVPAANAQPVSASAPAAAGASSAGFVGPGSDKVSLVKSITSGTSRNPQITTAANWGNLLGGAEAAAPAAPAQPVPDLAQRAPLDKTPLPPVRPAAPTAAAPAAASEVSNDWNQRPSGVPDAPVSIPLSSGGGDRIRIDDNTAPAPPQDVQPQPWPTPNDKPYGGHSTNWGPPKRSNDFLGLPPLPKPGEPGPFDPPTAPLSMTPGSMLASAQNLLKLLFPSTG